MMRDDMMLDRDYRWYHHCLACLFMAYLIGAGILIDYRLEGDIHWSWILVLLPLWLPILVMALLYLLAFIAFTYIDRGLEDRE